MQIRKPSLRAAVTALSVLLALALVSAPIVGSASLNGDPSSERERVRAQEAQVASQVDALQATDAQVEAALDTLAANVAGQQAMLAEARRAAEEAEAAFAEATEAVEAKTAEVELLRDEIREFAVDAFVHPPADDALAALDSDDPGEAAEKRALLEIQNTSDADLLDRLTAAEEDLEVQRQLAEDAAARAAAQAGRGRRPARGAHRRPRPAGRLRRPGPGPPRPQALRGRRPRADLDAELSAQIRADQARAAELARKAAAASPPPSAAAAVAVAVAAVATTATRRSARVVPQTGGSITVASSIAGNAAVAAERAAPDGISLCGGGYRSSQQQIETRRATAATATTTSTRCPARSARRPPRRRARRCTSGASPIDFTCNGGGVIGSRSSPCFQWLSANASSYGFYNLPSEPWHWSTNGELSLGASLGRLGRSSWRSAPVAASAPHPRRTPRPLSSLTTAGEWRKNCSTSRSYW